MPLYRRKPLLVEAQRFDSHDLTNPWPKGVMASGISFTGYALEGQPIRDGDWVIWIDPVAEGDQRRVGRVVGAGEFQMDYQLAQSPLEGLEEHLVEPVLDRKDLPVDLSDDEARHLLDKLFIDFTQTPPAFYVLGRKMTQEQWKEDFVAMRKLTDLTNQPGRAGAAMGWTSRGKAPEGFEI